MVFLNIFSHSQWRKVEKNARRKRIRQKKAQERDAILQEGLLSIVNIPKFTLLKTKL